MNPNRDGKMLRTKRRIVIVAALVTFTAACDSGEPLRVELQGDTLVSVALLTFEGGATSAECGFMVDAVATGAEGDSATIGAGKIVYTFVATGDTLITRPIDAASTPAFWEGDKATVAAGSKLTSKRQGISISQPTQPLRAFVTFSYTGTDSDEVHETAPFSVVCRSAGDPQ